MRACTFVAVLAVLACARGTTGQVGAPMDGTAGAVRAAVLAFGDAYAAADVEALQDWIADGYVHVNGGSGSVIGREAWLARVADRAEALAAGRLVLDRYEVSELEIQVHGGDAAVAAGVVDSRGRQEGERFATRIRFTNLWVRTGDGWKRVAFHDSAIPPAAGAWASEDAVPSTDSEALARRDSAAIEALHRRDRAASLEGDTPTLLSLWTEDAVALPPRGPVLDGHDAVARMLEAGAEARARWETVEYIHDFGEVMVLGDYAWDWATYRGRSRNRETGVEVSSNGKLLRILKRAPDGTWKVHRSIWNVTPAGDGAARP